MPQKCSICKSPNKLEMERAYMQGQPKSEIAKTYSVPYHSLDAHLNNHLSRQLVQAYEKKQLSESENIIGEVEELLRRTKRILTEAEQDGKYSLALSAIREARGSYELLSKIAYALHQARTQELELEQARQEYNKSTTDQQSRELLQVLDEDELKIYERLTRKIRTQNPDLKALPNKNRPLPDIDAYLTNDGNWEIQDRPQPERKRTSQPDSDQETEAEVEPEPESETVPMSRSTEIGSPDSDPEWMKRERRRYL